MTSELQELNAYLDAYTDYIKDLKARSDEKKLRVLSELRKIDMSVLDEADVFFINNEAEMLLPQYKDYYMDFGILNSANRPAFHHRWIIPIKNAEGQVVNIVGYTNDEQIRYLYGTAKYYNRTDDLYGMENLNLAYDLGYAILTEGITDTLAVKGLGLKNVFAWCGTSRSKKKQQILNRCRYGVIRIPDRDAAGKKTDEVQVFNNTLTLYVPLGFKDAAEYLATEQDYGNMSQHEYMFKTIEHCIGLIKKQEHKGRVLKQEPVNMS